MRIVQTYSHLNGLEYLKVHKPTQWQEIVEVISKVNAEACKTKVSKEVRIKGKKLFSPQAMNRSFNRHFAAKSWTRHIVSYWVTHDVRLIRKTLQKSAQEQKEDIAAAGETPIYSYNQTDFVKDRIAVEVQFGKYAFVAYDLFVKHLAFYIRDEIDVGIEILPMKSMQAQMSSGPGYYEGELYNVIRNGRGVPAVPLVLIGIAP
jgi:hypothetical protein